MDCTEFLNRYSEYDDSLVAPSEGDRFRSHMEGCDTCARYDRVLRKGRMLARQLPGVDPSDDFVPRLHARLWQHSNSAHRTAVLDRPAQAASALAAMTVLIVTAAGLGLLAQNGPAPSFPSQSYASGSASSYASATRTGAALPLLPGSPQVAPRAWASERVDRETLASYSPLVTGPPAYRGSAPYSGVTISAYRTLD